MPDNRKTIQPIRIGGIAVRIHCFVSNNQLMNWRMFVLQGGDKYLCHNILFKFAIDKNGLYGGDDDSAAKVENMLMGSCELRRDVFGLTGCRAWAERASELFQCGCTRAPFSTYGTRRYTLTVFGLWWLFLDCRILTKHMGPDYRGFRLLAIALLPVNTSSLIYGR